MKKRICSLLLLLALLTNILPLFPLAPHAEESVAPAWEQGTIASADGENSAADGVLRVLTLPELESETLEGKTLSILGASISTYAGTSNGAAADTTNSTIRSNVKYYPNTTIPDVTLNDTWWMQVCNDLGLRLLVNNSWSGSSLLHERSGTVGAYVDRCVQLHDDTGDNGGEAPDIIGIQMGTNDFQYYKDTLGTADIDYDALITGTGDGTYTYATPVTSLEAAAIVLHKISVRYPDAEVYYLNISQRVDGTDALIQSFNAELKQVVEHFGAHIVDIYGSAITMAEFDTYIGDGRVHPNKLGMDAYAEAFKRTLVENTRYAVNTHTVTLNLDGVTADYGDDKIVASGDEYTVTLFAAAEMGLDVTVTVGGKNITSAVYANGSVTIDSVNDDVTITAKAVYVPKDYRWEFDGTDLACVDGSNTLTKNAGTTTDGVFNKTCYTLENQVVLLHDLPWAVEWKSEGTFMNANGSTGARVFTSDVVNANYNARYIFKSAKNWIIAMGEKTSSGSHNYGIALADYGIDGSAPHTYRLENRITDDGSNMIYLFVDDKEIGPMNNYYIGTTSQNTTSNWLSGKDFVFPYMGTDTHGFTNCSIEYIQVWEAAHTHTYENGVCTGCGAEDPDGKKNDLLHIICYGQSFSTGSDAPVYPDPAVDGVYVYGSITDSSKGETLSPLATTGNQHPIISAGNVLAQMLKNAGYDADIVLGSYGSGGRTIAQLMSAERQAEIKVEEGYTYDIYSSGRYVVFQNSVVAIADYAAENGQSVSCPVIVYLQGETDQNTDAELGYPENAIRAGYGAGGDKEKYKEYMTRLKEDMQKEVMEAYGQTEKPLFLIYQVSGTYVRTKYSAINMAQLEFAQENDDVILVQTPYFTPHYTNSHHLTVNGYRWLGEYIGQTMYTALTTQEKTWPVLPKGFTVEDASTLRITVSGAVNGLTIDTWTVEDATNTGNLYGFYLTINGSRVVPQTVTVDGNDIILTLPDNAVPLNKAESVYVYYGGQGAKGTGNIRDNCSKTGFYCYLDDSTDTGTGNNQGVSHSALDENGNSLIGQPYPLYNWLASFCYEIEVPEAEEEQAAFYHWEMQETGLVCVSEDQNNLTLLQGSVENGVLMNVQYSMEETVVLYHNQPWAIEWKAAGNGSSYGGGMLLVAADGSTSKAGSLYIPADSRGMVAWNVSSESRNYGFKLGAEGIDTRQEHTYRIENRIAEDGTNTVYLIVDGVEIGDMNTSFSTSNSSQNDEATNWANGADIFLSYMGKPTSFLLKNMKLSYLKIWEDTHTHSYTATVTAATCTERGYTTYTCTCGDSYVDDYVEANGHSYENGICTACGTEHPNMINYEGKVISILGDSISTFAGYIPTADGFNLEHLARYPQDNLLTDVHETWWMQIINDLDAKLGINDSWRGATVSGAAPVTSGTTGENAAMGNLQRIKNLGANGTPDVILFYGGTNDLAHVSKVGTFDPATAPAEVDLITLKWDNLADGYVHTLLRLRYYYPDAEIIAMLPTYTTGYYSNEKLAQANAVLADICGHYGVTCVDLRDCGITTADLPDGIHPDANGMDYITDAVLETLLAECKMEAGENVVYSVTHDLTDVTASLGYYKGVSAGKPFAETLTADDTMTVTVTMGGEDITDECRLDGTLTIPAVTGDVVVTAKAEFSLGGRLQQLPEELCAGTNLWQLLEHDAEYYTVSGWGVHSSGRVYSVTVPVTPGDQLWATSFGAAGINGGTINGIRLTWFGENGVLKSLSAGETYAQFTADGYLTAPAGASAVNVVMWNGDDSNEFYILNRAHEYTATITAPTCTERGYTTHVCACGDSYVDSYVDALGHAFGEWSEVIAPKCDTEGQDKRECAVCGDVQYRDTRISGIPNKILVSNPVEDDYFAGKVIMAIGDSLTAGTGVTAEERYHYLTAQALGMTNINSGTSGAVLCPGGHLPNKFETLMTAEFLTKRNVDVVTIFLGINDWDNGVVNGTYQGKLKYDESLTYYDLGEFGTDDTTTIYGAAKMWCERIKELQETEECEHIQFVFITPVITSYNKSVTNKRDWDQNKVNVFGYSLRQYCTAIMEVCASYDIPVLDQYMYSGMYYHSEDDNNVDYFGGDGIHPGANGHAMMADALTEFLLEGYTYEERIVADCGHSYETTITTPTCTEGGYTTYRCPECYYSYEDHYTEAAGHSYTATITAPTCTEQGYTTHTCAVCGDSYVDSYVGALGHGYAVGESVDGERHRVVCTVCGDVQLQAHDWSAENRCVGCGLCGVEAALQDGVLTVTLHRLPCEEFSLVVAAYDTYGKMIACTVPVIPEGNTLTCAVGQADTVCVFVLDGTYRPVMPPVPAQ